MNKKKIIITRGSGMIGGIILKHAMASDTISHIVSIVRKPLGIMHPK